MTAIPASWWQPYTLQVFHRDTGPGIVCGCGQAGGELIRQSVSTGLPGLTTALDEAEAAVDDEDSCAGWYEAAGPSDFTRNYP